MEVQGLQDQHHQLVGAVEIHEGEADLSAATGAPAPASPEPGPHARPPAAGSSPLVQLRLDLSDELGLFFSTRQGSKEEVPERTTLITHPGLARGSGSLTE